MVGASQYVAADLNKKSCSGPKIKVSYIPRFKIAIYQNPTKSGMYNDFFKNNNSLMQQLKVLVASSIKTVL